MKQYHTNGDSAGTRPWLRFAAGAGTALVVVGLVASIHAYAQTASSTATTTPQDPASLEAQAIQLQDQINSMQTQLNTLWQEIGVLWSQNGNGTIPPPPPSIPSAAASVMPASTTASAGTSIDWSGYNFGYNEPVAVSLNGQTVTTAYADGGGNFTTGSIGLPATAGTYTYTFSDQNGDSLDSTVTVE